MGNIQTSGLNEAVLISGDDIDKNSPPPPKKKPKKLPFPVCTQEKLQCKAMKTSYNQTYFDLNVYTISGGCCGSTSKKTVVGGWAWAWWLVTDVQR